MKKLIAILIMSTFTSVFATTKIEPTELTAFAEKIEKSIQAKNPSFLNNAFDKITLGEKLTKGNVKQDFKNKFLKGYFDNFHFGDAIVNACTQPNSSYRIVHTYQKNGESHILFRMILANGGLNYHDYQIIKKASGELKIADIYVYTNGETISHQGNRIFLQAALSLGMSKGDKISPQEKAMLSAFATLRKMAQANTQNKPLQVIKFYKELPEKFQKQKVFMLLALLNYAKFSEPDYIKTMEKYKGLFPNDPSLNLILLDYYFLKKEWKNLNATIDELNQKVGGDPYLQLYKASIALVQKDYKTAMKKSQTVIEKLPYITNAYFTYITAALKIKDFKGVTKQLQALKKQGVNIDKSILETTPIYKEYIKSEEYKNL